MQSVFSYVKCRHRPSLRFALLLTPRISEVSQLEVFTCMGKYSDLHKLLQRCQYIHDDKAACPISFSRIMRNFLFCLLAGHVVLRKFGVDRFGLVALKWIACSCEKAAV